jgi:heptosyltransferase II
VTISRNDAILVIRLSSLGDVLLTAPALRRLRARFPENAIHLLVAAEYADAAGLIPGPDRVLTFDRKTGLPGLARLRKQLAGRYAVVVDLQNSVRSVFLRATIRARYRMPAKRYRWRRWLLIRFKKNLYHSVYPVPERYLSALHPLGVASDGRGLDLSGLPTAQSRADEYLLSWNPGNLPLCVLCPGARHATKRWPEDRWWDVGRGLRENGFVVLVVGGLGEEQLTHSVADAIPGAAALTDRTVPEVAAIFSRASVVVCHDSGLMHLATGVGTPVVAIFGPTVAEFGFYPYHARAIVLDHHLYCRPCTAMGGARCPEKHFRCMLETTSSQTLSAIQRLLTETGAESR